MILVHETRRFFFLALCDSCCNPTFLILLLFGFGSLTMCSRYRLSPSSFTYFFKKNFHSLLSLQRIFEDEGCLSRMIIDFSSVFEHDGKNEISVLNS